jgi:uncharacterized membrane protein YeaQ/YmgE (transglycosylase-associated protein family)
VGKVESEGSFKNRLLGLVGAQRGKVALER